MPSLHEITGLDDYILQTKLKLEPQHRFDPNEPDNLVFMSPTILLDDSQLRFGGTNELGAKEFLGLITKRILEEEDSSLFKVPEITSTHMGYGVKSSNKEGKRGIEQAEADYWMTKLTAVKNFDVEHINPGPDVEIPTPANDPEVYEESPDLISEEISGLEIPVKGSYLLFFSILLIYFGLKKPKLESRDAGNIGPNKVSDFLIFWTLPFLLSFSNRKLSEIEHHCQNNEKDRELTIPTVQITAEKVIENACKSINETRNYVDTLLEVYRDLLGSEAIAKPYTVLAARDGSPIILIPLEYQETKLPVELKHLGKRSTWSKLGRTTLLKEFLNKFVKNKAVQMDIFRSMEDEGNFQGIDYGIILPDVKTYDVFIREVERNSQDYLTRLRKYPARGQIVPHCGVLQDDTKQITLSISYLPDMPSSKSIAATFHALGSQYVDHRTIAILHGTVLNDSDPQFRVGNIHPVRAADKIVKGENGKLCRSGKSKNHKKHVINFLSGRGQFSAIDFPLTYLKWEKEVEKIDVIRDTDLKPRYEHDTPVKCLYIASSVPDSLRENILPGIRNSKEPEKFPYRVLNQNGCAMKLLAGYAGKDRLSLLLALKDYAGKFRKTLGVRKYDATLQQVVKYFTMAIITAGLPAVYPRGTLTVGDMVEEQADSDDDDEDDDDGDEDCVDAAGEPAAKRIRSESVISVERGKEQGNNSEEQVDDLLLSKLSKKIPKEWDDVALYLGFDNDEIEGIIDECSNSSEQKKAKAMLIRWKRSDGRGKGATREVLAAALREAGLSALVEF